MHSRLHAHVESWENDYVYMFVAASYPHGSVTAIQLSTLASSLSNAVRGKCCSRFYMGYTA